MGKTVNIIDTSQLLDEPRVIEHILDKYKNQHIYLIKNVINEIKNKMNIPKNAKAAKTAIDIINKHRKGLAIVEDWRPTNTDMHADPAIAQFILEKLCDKNISKIYVYTKDKALGLLCCNLAESQTIEHSNVQLSVYTYENGKPPRKITKERLEEDIAAREKKNANKTESKPKSKLESEKLPVDNKPCKKENKNEIVLIDEPDVMMWRDQKPFEGVNTKASSYKKISKHLGNIEVTKFFAANTLKGDVLRLYKKIPVHKGDIIKTTLLLHPRDNAIDVGIHLWNENNNYQNSEKYIRLKEDVPTEIELTSNGEYDYANIDLCIKKDSVEKHHFKGTDGYIYDFKIIRSSDN